MEDGKCSCGTDGKYTVIKLTQEETRATSIYNNSCEGLLLVVIEQKAQKDTFFPRQQNKHQ